MWAHVCQVLRTKVSSCGHIGATVSAVATKPRHRKTAMQLWVADNRKALGKTSLEIATATGVTEDTARGWESRGSPGEDAITVLERLFGKPAPRDASAVGDQGALVTALTRQTEAIEALVEEMRLARERDQDAAAAMMRAAEVLLSAQRPQGDGASTEPPALHAR